MEIRMNNASINPEARWATYSKGILFLIPALAAWSLSIVFVFPKIEQICANTGVYFPSMFGPAYFFRDYAIYIFTAIAAALLFLEWRSEIWRKYRRFSVGTVIYLFNLAFIV